MYHAKTTGRSNFQWFTSAMLQQTQEKLALSAALRRAIEGNELEIVFQPEILLRDGSIIGMEALTRWHSTPHGEVSPDRFIPVAEDTRRSEEHTSELQTLMRLTDAVSSSQQKNHNTYKIHK